MEKIDLNELRDRAYKTACEHGFHDKEFSDEHWKMLIITEIAEAVEADRKDKWAAVTDFNNEVKLMSIDSKAWRNNFETYIKDSVHDEISDVIIRLLDFAGLKGVDLEWDEEMLQIFLHRNSVPPFSEQAFNLVEYIVRYEDLNDLLMLAISLAQSVSGDEWLKFVQWKMKYNDLRPRLNGKTY